MQDEDDGRDEESYTPGEVKSYAGAIGSLQGYSAVADLGGGLTLETTERSTGPNMGGRAIHWRVLAGEELAGAGTIEHDDEFAEETGNPAWVAQQAFVLDGYQRRGIYSEVLKFFAGDLGKIYPDVHRSDGAKGAWRKAGLGERSLAKRFLSHFDLPDTEIPSNDFDNMGPVKGDEPHNPGLNPPMVARRVAAIMGYRSVDRVPPPVFAMKMSEILGADIIFTSEYTDLPDHLFIQHKGLYYDPHHPEGVRDPLELSVFSREFGESLLMDMRRRFMGVFESVPPLDLLEPFRSGAECYDVAGGVERKFPELKADSGFYAHDGRFSDHAWNVASDGTIVDMTAEQFGPRTPNIVPPGTRDAMRYVSWTKNETRAQEIAHGEGYHTPPNGDPVEVCPLCP